MPISGKQLDLQREGPIGGEARSLGVRVGGQAIVHGLTTSPTGFWDCFARACSLSASTDGGPRAAVSVKSAANGELRFGAAIDSLSDVWVHRRIEGQLVEVLDVLQRVEGQLGEVDLWLGQGLDLR